MTVFHRLNVAAIERETPDAVAITLRVPDETEIPLRLYPRPTSDAQSPGQR
ncbi:Uncharacterised protein [Serratia fonticola]|uniref:Uncharacterized protein n=1 Tax=Serratia fonticola TaxID=47917 RepID=A0A4U9WNP0_SERFO|nr:Uncharacterised protein [Serratia fonticola]